MKRITKAAFKSHGRRPMLARGIACAGLMLLLASRAWAPLITIGPSVRVNPDTSMQFEWITDVIWLGKVEVFTNPDGTGAPLATAWVVDTLGNKIAATQQTLTWPVAAPFAADTGYFFRVSAVDPTGTIGDITNPTPLPPFFTGAQVLTNVQAESITTSSATIAWQGNVIGFGKVAYGTSSLNQTVQDTVNITDHAIQLTGLSPATTYQFTASNIHAIDGDALASANGQFTTAGVTTTVMFTGPDADPRVIHVGDVSTVSIHTKNQGSVVPGVVVAFAIDPGSAGNGTLSTAQAVTDANGIASVQFTATGSGLVRVAVSASNAANSPLNIPVVVH